MSAKGNKLLDKRQGLYTRGNKINKIFFMVKQRKV